MLLLLMLTKGCEIRQCACIDITKSKYRKEQYTQRNVLFRLRTKWWNRFPAGIKLRQWQISQTSTKVHSVITVPKKNTLDVVKKEKSPKEALCL